MKRFTAILVLCCVLLQCTLQLGVVGYYELNKTFIAQNLCENRDKPQLKCCGKCYLRRQLKKADSQGDTQKNIRTEKYELLVFVLPAAPLPFSQPILQSATAVRRPVQQRMYDAGICGDIFHPPGSSC